MKFGSLDGGGDAEHKCGGFVKTSKIFLYLSEYNHSTEVFKKASSRK